MTPNTSPRERLLGVQSRRELSEGSVELPPGLSLPDALALTAHLQRLGPAPVPLRLGIVHTYTSDLLDPWLRLHAAIQGLAPEVYHAPYGLSPLEAEPDSGLARHGCDLTLMLLQREDLHPLLAAPLGGLGVSRQRSLADEVLTRLADLVERFRGAAGGRLILSLLPSPWPPGAGLYDAQSDHSEVAWWAGLKVAIAALLRERTRGATLLDLDGLLAELGREAMFDRRLWYSVRYPFTAAAATELARRVIALGVVERLPRAKVIVLDADNTLWGGIIGEDGIGGIALGPDYPGNTFLDFQRRLLDYQQRGFLLALCSKNNPEDVAEVLEHHPHQLLRNGQFAARRVNWRSKTENLMELAAELNLGLDAFVFVDDSDHECAEVRRALPEVTVVKTPDKPVKIPGCLDRIARLEVVALTTEDRKKTALYAAERQRHGLRERLVAEGADALSYLASLQMRMRISLKGSGVLARLAQLTQKTNQFNLTTRRYSEETLAALMANPDWLIASFSLADVFGDSGVVGLAMIERVTSERVVLDTFLMSCRVIGRTAESAFLEALLGRLQDAGITTVVGDYLPTPKNRLVADFLPRHGFVVGADGRFVRSLREAPPRPAADLPIEVTFVD